MEENADKMARHYAEIIHSRPNGWGQHISPIYGQSHNILNRMSTLFGTEAMSRAIDKAMAEHKETNQ